MLFWKDKKGNDGRVAILVSITIASAKVALLEVMARATLVRDDSRVTQEETPWKALL